jgi:hypothetical protein
MLLATSSGHTERCLHWVIGQFPRSKDNPQLRVRCSVQCMSGPWVEWEESLSVHRFGLRGVSGEVPRATSQCNSVLRFHFARSGSVWRGSRQPCRFKLFQRVQAKFRHALSATRAARRLSWSLLLINRTTSYCPAYQLSQRLPSTILHRQTC